jgi:hypothetical protein
MKSTSYRLVACALIAGCGGGSTADSPTPNQLTSCAPGTELTGASYKLDLSRFAFGSTPTRDDTSMFARWVGADGVVAISPNGSEIGLLNGGAPEASLPDWSADPTALALHVRGYWEAMGVADCQVMAPQILGGSGGRDVTLLRGVDGIMVSESLADARFEDADQTTSETFYWPTIPADVVAAARAFRDRLADSTMRAAYEASLPAEARGGDGQVVIHHAESSSTTPFWSAATYDVQESTPNGPGLHHFDATGKEVLMPEVPL